MFKKITRKMGEEGSHPILRAPHGLRGPPGYILRPTATS